MGLKGPSTSPSPGSNPHAKPYSAFTVSNDGWNDSSTRGGKFRPINGPSAQRTLFPDKDKSTSGNWDDAPTSDNANEPVAEQWDADDGPSTNASATSSTNTITNTTNPPSSQLVDSANMSPYESPSLNPYRGDPGDEKLILDERGTDISLSLMKKEAESGDVSIHMLSLLYDPPVQGCEIKPYVSVVSVIG